MKRVNHCSEPTGTTYLSSDISVYLKQSCIPLLVQLCFVSSRVIYFQCFQNSSGNIHIPMWLLWFRRFEKWTQICEFYNLIADCGLGIKLTVITASSSIKGNLFVHTCMFVLVLLNKIHAWTSSCVHVCVSIVE